MLKYNKNRKRKNLVKQFIGIEYLATMALINVYERKNEKQIKLSALSDYGIRAMKVFDENNISAVILFSTEYAEQMVRDYSDCFEIKSISDEEYLILKISVDDLKRRFVGYLTLDIIKALMSNEAVEGL